MIDISPQLDTLIIIFSVQTFILFWILLLAVFKR